MLGGTLANNELTIGAANAKTKVPTKIFLTRLFLSLNAERVKLLHQSASYIIAITTIIDEIVSTFRRIKHRILKRNHCTNLCNTLEAA